MRRYHDIGNTAACGFNRRPGRDRAAHFRNRCRFGSVARHALVFSIAIIADINRLTIG